MSFLTQGTWVSPLLALIAGMAFVLVLQELRRIRRAIERPDDFWAWRNRR